MDYDSDTPRSPRKDERKPRFFHIFWPSFWAALAGLAFFRLLLLLINILRKLLAAPAPEAPVEPVVLEPAAPVEAPPAGEIESPLELLTAPPVEVIAPPEAEAYEEEGLSLAITEELPAAEAEDLLSVPPEAWLQETFDPRYQFNWQNPELRQTIYPFRKSKLIDFMAYYDEIDLVQQYRGKTTADPVIAAKIKSTEARLRQEREDVDVRLKAAVEERKLSDPFFARITVTDERNMRFKYGYYLDREIERLGDKLEELENRKLDLEKRVNWTPQTAETKQMWLNRANELLPAITELKDQIAPIKEFRGLLDRQASLPAVSTVQIDLKVIQREEIRLKRQAYEKLTEEQLMEALIKRVNAEPDRFPEWLLYMVVHFSGMRYISAHGSWADPRYLLELLEREDEKSRVESILPEKLDEACKVATSELQKLIKPTSNDPLQKSIAALIQRLLNPVQKKAALIEYRIDKTLREIQALQDDDACLDRLVQFKAERDASPDPKDRLPEWMWAEIVKYTPLRLNTNDPDWEAYSPERWKYQNQRWTTVLNQWEQKDITAWRQKHRETLDLVVTRSVCNELGEHIQHLRGVVPAAGLTAKPNWYLRQVEKDPKRAYFKQSPSEADFKTGASILWLEWMVQKPSPWQMARPLTGFELYPGERTVAKPGLRGEVPKKDLADKNWDATSNWRYRPFNGFYIRSRNKPTSQELKAMGKTPDAIKKTLDSYKQTGSIEEEYLRWRHEATVVGVVDMIDGRYVLTFETGKIGVILRRLDNLAGNPMVFVGYVPEMQMPQEMDEKLVNMLRWDRIAPGKALGERVRPRRLSETELARVMPTPIAPIGPQRVVMVVRDQVRLFKFTTRDNLGRPKFEAASPPVHLARSVRMGVSASHKESTHDRGNGIVIGQNGSFLKVVSCQVEPRAVGLFVKLEEVEDFSQSYWLMVHPLVDKTNIQVLKGYDRAGKPWFAPISEKDARLKLPGSTRVRVSSVHKESFVDKGDGIINSSGLYYTYYLVLECPTHPQGAGLFVNAREMVPAD